MKITETNSEQWEISESGIGTVVAGIAAAVIGIGLLGWVLVHLATIAWWWVLVAIGIMTIGGLMVFLAVNRQIILRKMGSSEIMTTKVIGGKQTRLSFDSSQIVSVNLDTSDELSARTGGGGGAGTTRERTSTLYVLLQDNSQVVLSARKGSNNGITINGINMSGLIKAPLADEAQRIAAFYGVPLSSRANNVGGIEAITNVVGAIKQGISGAQQPVLNVQLQAQPSPQSVDVTPVAQSTMPVATPIQQVAPVVTVVPPAVQATMPMAAPSPASEPVTTGEQLPR